VTRVLARTGLATYTRKPTHTHAHSHTQTHTHTHTHMRTRNLAPSSSKQARGKTYARPFVDEAKPGEGGGMLGGLEGESWGEGATGVVVLLVDEGPLLPMMMLGLSVRMCVCVYVCIRTCMCMCVWICIRMCMCMCVCMCMCM
jgi:hypothetical protein